MTRDDPTDEQLRALVNAVPDDRRRQILELVAELEGMEHVATWRGGEVVDHTADGSPVIQMPWAEHAEQLDSLCRLLYESELIVPFDWSSWAHASGYGQGRSLDELTVADAVRLITGLVRSDRFVEGQLVASVEDGRLSAAIRAALSVTD